LFLPFQSGGPLTNSVAMVKFKTCVNFFQKKKNYFVQYFIDDSHAKRDYFLFYFILLCCDVFKHSIVNRKNYFHLEFIACKRRQTNGFVWNYNFILNSFFFFLNFKCYLTTLISHAKVRNFFVICLFNILLYNIIFC
jgi:hypothetical protein